MLLTDETDETKRLVSKVLETSFLCYFSTRNLMVPSISAQYPSVIPY